MNNQGIAFKLKALTVNIHKGFGFLNRRFVLAELREAVRHVGADIMFLQEVLGAHAVYAERLRDWPAAPQYEYLADTLWPNFAYGRNVVYPHGNHGNALLSKFPILRHENLDISQRGDEKRGLLHGVVDLGVAVGRACELHVICVHLGLSEGHRRAQLELLCRHVREGVPDDAPLIVAGDFNDWRQRASALMTACGLHEVFVMATGALAKTFPARWPLLPLDRIYLRNARAHHPQPLPRRPWSHLSDHVPLVTEIEL